ncbi:hypothetical protein HYDPIDRAFT_26910 [Hydnomerulius pinastri MD-312]|nr:hypothetical protein HYDPIDRAFT_26910 [Hydnomerulius pinastri MD-312]
MIFPVLPEKRSAVLTLCSRASSKRQAPTMVLPEIEDALRQHVYNQMPIRLLKLPEMQLMDRAAIFDYLLLKHAKYAILSHTWVNDEMSYQDMKERRGLGSAGYKKIETFCTIAFEKHLVDLAWVDSVCINKESSSELDESIRSMFRWYHQAHICIIRLSTATSLEQIAGDRWLTRGWTLQELLAPIRAKIYGANWVPLTPGLNDKELGSPILEEITKATGISGRAQVVFYSSNYSLDEKMGWAAKRSTTRGEDRAYSLMGLLGVSFPTAYGEGDERAFFRLMEAIIQVHDDLDGILNWSGKPVNPTIHRSRMIASSPECFLSSAQLMRSFTKSGSRPTVLISAGLQIRVLVIPVDFSTDSTRDVLLKFFEKYQAPRDKFKERQRLMALERPYVRRGNGSQGRDEVVWNPYVEDEDQSTVSSQSSGDRRPQFTDADRRSGGGEVSRSSPSEDIKNIMLPGGYCVAKLRSTRDLKLMVAEEITIGVPVFRGIPSSEGPCMPASEHFPLGIWNFSATKECPFPENCAAVLLAEWRGRGELQSRWHRIETKEVITFESSPVLRGLRWGDLDAKDILDRTLYL